MEEKGQLIALEGTGGGGMLQAAKRLARAMRRAGAAAPGISAWDASGIFFEILEGSRGMSGGSPRNLVLLLRADPALRVGGRGAARGRGGARPGREAAHARNQFR